jgi:sulfate permease, SulP family
MTKSQDSNSSDAIANLLFPVANFCQQFDPKTLPISLAAGLLSGIIGVLFDTSLAAFVFSGDLTSNLAQGIGIVLLSAIALRVITSLTSSFPTITADIDTLPVAVLAGSAAAINNSSNGADAETIFVTILATFALTAWLTGAFLLALGQFKVGELIRFIPYPAIAGFLAGTGWLLFRGSLTIMTDVTLNFSSLGVLFQTDILLRWLPGLIFAAVLVLISRRYNHWSIVPTAIIAAIGLFYLFLWASNISVEAAIAKGWLLEPFASGSLWKPFNPTKFIQADWSVISTQMGDILTIAAISPIAILLNASALELAAECDIDFNQELKSAGIANLAVGVGGGLVGYHTLSDSLLVYRLGASSRLVGLISAGVFAIALFFGASTLSLFPKPILGGLLLFFGLSLLVESLWDAWDKLPKAEYFIVLLILVVVGAVGFLQGVGVGLVAEIILFAIDSSRIDVAKRVDSGVNYRSRVQRPPNQAQLLRQKGEQTYILELQGLIFFGTANKLLNQIRERLALANENLRFVILDFRQVTGLDSSAVLSFAKLKQIAKKQSLHLVLTDLPPTAAKQFHQGGVLETSDPVFQVFPDLDRGLEWCESQILEVIQLRGSHFLPLVMQLYTSFLSAAQATKLMQYLELVQLSEGELLFRQGDPSEGLYFIESGQVSVVVELSDGETKRLRTYSSGAIVGEMGLYGNAPRFASVVSDRTSRLYHLSNQAFARIETEEPQLAATFHKFIVNLLAERLRNCSLELQNFLN